MTGQWSKSRIIFLGIGVVLVAIGVWMILPQMS
jgi:hypothetical protein